jgi:uncharacterized repeat protein (TIGR03803 family)
LIAGKYGDFYGTTYYGGSNSLGTVFQVTTNGALTSLISFTGINGANPVAGLILGSDGKFYGTTYSGGGSNLGTAYELTTNGVLTPLVSFTSTNGAYPYAGLIPGSDGNFYGTAANGGNGGNGTVFKIVVPPTLGAVSIFNHVFQATLNGLARPSLQIQTTTNLATAWLVLTNLVFTNGFGQFTDSTATNVPKRFYRTMAW